MPRKILLILTLVALAGCGRTKADVIPTVTPDETRIAELLPGTPEPTDDPPPTLTLIPTGTPDDPDWDDPTPGIERREIIVTEPRSGDQVRLHVVRINPQLFDFKVHHEPGKADSISHWQATLQAPFVVNGGFFDGDYNVAGTTFIDGKELGVSPGYEDLIGVGGLFAVKDGEVQIVELGKEADPPGTYQFDYATQSYPILLSQGGVPAYPEDTGHVAERTIVGIDSQGRVIFIVIRPAVFTLYGLSQMLADTEELDLQIALNLDGGKSSGMEVYAGREHTHWNAQTPLPIVIAAYPKEGVPVVPTLPVAPRLE